MEWVCVYSHPLGLNPVHPGSTGLGIRNLNPLVIQGGCPMKNLSLKSVSNLMLVNLLAFLKKQNI